MQPPPIPSPRPPTPSGATTAPPATPAVNSSAQLRTTQPFAGKRDALPPPSQADVDRRALVNAISPGPAAQRREAPPVGAHDATQLAGEPLPARRASDGPKPNAAIPSIRAKPVTTPPPTPSQVPRVKPPTLPPPGPHSGPVATTPPPPVPVQPAYPVIPARAFDDDFNTQVSADPVHVAARRMRSPTGVEPPPTRIQRSEAADVRPFTPPKVTPVPEIPEPGLINAARYTVDFGRARWQRRGAIKTLGGEIKQDTDALDHVLGALGREARVFKVEGRVFSAENAAINEAENRIADLGQEHGDVDARKVDENSKFVDVERERNTKLVEAERLVEEGQKELAHLEGQRRSLRDKRKELERRQKAYLKNAEDNDRQAGSAQLGDARQELRRSAEGHRKEAAALEPERQELDRKLASLERPIGEATARFDAAKAELDAAKRSLHDAREGHTHRLAELDAEQKRKFREISLAEAEIQRRLVTLGTLVNLNRIEDPGFAELYERIDRIRGAITARTTEIEKLTAEREAFDRGTLVRGVSTIGGAIVLFIALIVILRAAI
jgi:hypothetical protein